MRFVDTSFWYALQNARDRHHDVAAAIAASETGSLLTSNHVLSETWTLLCRRVGHGRAVGFLDRLERTVDLEMAHVEPAIEDQAWQWLRLHDEREYSFVDATSFALMRARRVREALAFDGDFAAAGFIEVRPR